MELSTIGFAGRSAEEFFGALRAAGVTRLIDVRRYNTSQLAGYTKRRDLPWLLRELCDAGYTHRIDLAPTPELIGAYRKEGLEWETFADRYREQIADLDAAALVEELCDRHAVLLCSEADADRCHRSVLADTLTGAVPALGITHL